tara:strand:+ start:6627 stop:7631 length:1005 start_codon:yes stop_codon:yes gene_type:complete
MNKILIVKPSFDNGNIGDLALINTIQKLYNYPYFIPDSKLELNNQNVKNYDLIIYFGNDCIPYYSSCVPYIKIKEFLKNNKKVHIINTSWGNNPKNKNINLLKSIANDPNFQIYMRDKYSHELIQKDIKFYNTPILTADLAFLCKQNKNNKIDKLENWMNENDKPIIGINTHYDFKEYNNKVRIEIEKIIIDNKDKYRYLFIPHDSRKKEFEDLQQLHKSCNEIDGYTTNYLDPEYEKYITSKLYLVITGRMHLSILTIPNEVPCIAIAYNGIKAKGTFEHWGISNLVIEPKNIKNLPNLVQYIIDNYEMIQDKIKSNKDNVKKLVNKQIIKFI